MYQGLSENLVMATSSSSLSVSSSSSSSASDSRCRLVRSEVSCSQGEGAELTWRLRGGDAFLCEGNLREELVLEGRLGSWLQGH